MNYAKKLYEKHLEGQSPVFDQGSQYYFHSGFKFEKLPGMHNYKVYNLHYSYYVEVPEVYILRKMYEAKTLRGWAEKIRRIWECEDPIQIHKLMLAL